MVKGEVSYPHSHPHLPRLAIHTPGLEAHKVSLVLCAGGCQRRAQGPAHCYPRDTAFTQITREQKGPSFEGQRGSKQIAAGTEPSLWGRIASLVRPQHYLKRVLQSFLLAEPLVVEGLSPCPNLCKGNWGPESGRKDCRLAMGWARFAFQGSCGFKSTFYSQGRQAYPSPNSQSLNWTKN